MPRLLAMLCILAVFLPSFFMQGAARALFVPLSLAVGFAMIASYLLSSTFVPVLSVWLLRQPTRRDDGTAGGPLFERVRDAYGRALARRRPLALGWSCRPTWPLRPWSIVGVGRELGLEIFPKVDAGQFQLRMRGPDRDADRGDRGDRHRRRSRRSASEVGPDERRDLGRLRRR